MQKQQKQDLIMTQMCTKNTFKHFLLFFLITDDSSAVNVIVHE